MAEGFDFEAALKAVQPGQSITGKDGVPGALVKQLTEAALEAELDSHRVGELKSRKDPPPKPRGPRTMSRCVQDPCRCEPFHRVGVLRVIELRAWR